MDEHEKVELKEPEKKKDSNFLKRYDTVLSFLGIEVIALILFGLGGATGTTILSLIGFLVAIIGYPYIKNNFEKRDFKIAFITLIPIVFLALLLSFSKFHLSSYQNKFSAVILCLASFVGLLGATLLGCMLKNIKTVRKEYIFLGIGAGLALIVLITFMISMVKYGPFYVTKYKDMVYYYDGVLFKIDDEAKILNGFAIQEAKLSFALFSAFLLSLFGIGMFFYRPKKQTKEFVICGVFTLIGFLNLALTPYFSGLILSAVTYVIFGLFYLYHHLIKDEYRDTVGRIIYICLIILIVGAVGIFVICSLQASNPLAKMGGMFSEQGRFGKLSKQIYNTFYTVNDTGARNIAFSQILFGVSITSKAMDTSWAFEFNILMENGFVAFILLIYFIFFLFRKARNNYVRGNEHIALRALVLTLIFGVLLYQSLFCDELPLKHATTHMPFTRSAGMYLLFFLLGYVYTSDKKPFIVFRKFDEVEGGAN